MSRGPYKRARLRGIGGRWPAPEEATPGRRERVHDVPPPGRPWLGGNVLVDDARTRHVPRSARKGPRRRPNTRRGIAGGQARMTRGRKGVVEHRLPRMQKAG